MDPIEETLPEAPTDVDPDRLAEVVEELAQMNSDDWSTFTANGVRATTPVRVEFGFTVPAEAAARDLADDLVTEGYEATANEPEGEYAEWAVKGTTSAATVTERGLLEWVRRLAAYGLDHDGAVLDGWAAVL